MKSACLPYLFGPPVIYSEAHTCEGTMRELHEALDWFSAMGANPEPTRVGRYLKHLHDLDKAVKKDRDMMTAFYKAHDFGEHVLILSEVEEILAVYRFLSSQSSATFLEKLKKSLEGGLIPGDETPRASASLPRNILFELFLGSVFVAAGFEISFTEAADLAVRFQARDIFVECKRPQHDHSVNGAIKGAASQLLKRYSSSSDPDSARGLIALSISKVITRGMLYRISHKEPAFPEDSYSFFLEFIARHKRRWNAKADAKTLGVILYLNLPHVVLEGRRIYLGQCFAWCRMEKLSTEDVLLADGFFDKFGTAQITSKTIPA